MNLSSGNFVYFCKSDVSAVSAVQGHPRSLILVPIESAVGICDFLLVRNSNLGILHRFRDSAAFIMLLSPSLFHLNFWGVPVAPDRPCWGQPAHALSYIRPWNYFRSSLFQFSTCVKIIPQRHKRTDGRTDRQTTYCGITALCVASRGKNFSRISYDRFWKSQIDSSLALRCKRENETLNIRWKWRRRVVEVCFLAQIQNLYRWSCFLRGKWISQYLAAFQGRCGVRVVGCHNVNGWSSSKRNGPLFIVTTT